ncbi:MAG TPA: DUF4363 family protein [Syntrophomonadaceae bacterium]|nr:DUF4363 family protein [Syntrophomonadaceae bacterium]
MRLLGTLAVLMACIIGTGFWLGCSLETSADKLSYQIDKVNAEIKRDCWEAAVEENAKLEQAWNGEAKWWPIFLDHQEMDNIEFCMARLKGYINGQDYSLSVGQLSELKLMIQHIPEKEAVNLKNIL